jgi:hypothetical protein
MVIALGGRPVNCDTAYWFQDCPWVGAQISTESPLKCAVAFIGSMQTCARNGTSYVACTLLAPLARAARTSPVFIRSAAVGPFASSAQVWYIPGELTSAMGPSFQAICSASRPFFAAQKLSATTATPEPIWTTFFTPLTFSACSASKLFTWPPNTGHFATVATSIPGRFTSRP